jgi:hypothetical protein
VATGVVAIPDADVAGVVGLAPKKSVAAAVYGAPNMDDAELGLEEEYPIFRSVGYAAPTG